MMLERSQYETTYKMYRYIKIDYVLINLLLFAYSYLTKKPYCTSKLHPKSLGETKSISPHATHRQISTQLHDFLTENDRHLNIIHDQKEIIKANELNIWI